MTSPLNILFIESVLSATSRLAVVSSRFASSISFLTASISVESAASSMVLWKSRA